MWAKVHKIDRIRPQPGGGAIVLVEDERTVGQMSRVPSLSTIIAVAREYTGPVLTLRQCPTCNAANPAVYRFCLDCGTRLAEAR